MATIDEGDKKQIIKPPAAPDVTTPKRNWQPSENQLNKINNIWADYMSGNQRYSNLGGDTHKIAYPYPGQVPTNEPWRANERQYTYWERPQRIARYYNMIRSAPPDWQAPDWLDVNAVREAYDYMKAKNNTSDWTQWKALADDDPGVEFLQSLTAPPIEFVLPSEQAQAQHVLTEQQIAQQQPVDWEALPGWMKGYLGIFAPQAEGIKDRPNINRLSASAAQSLMIGVGVGLGVTAIASPVAGIIAGLAATGLLTYQNYTGGQIPLLNEAMIPFNILAEAAESTIGNAMLASVEGLPEVMDDIPSAYRSGLTAYETWKFSNVPNWFAKSAKVRGKYDGPIADDYEIWKISQGILTPQKAPYGKGGEAIAHYHEWIESGAALSEFMELKNAGQVRGRFQDFITQRAYEDYGDTAISNDIFWQTTLDPLNFAPYALGKTTQFTAGKVLKNTTNPNTIRIASQILDAAKKGTGNPLVDILPIGVQQAVKGITHIQDSAGALGIYKLYQGNIRSNYLSSLSKYASSDMAAKVDALIKDGIRPEDVKYLDDTLIWKDRDGIEQVYVSEEGSRIDIPNIEDLTSFEKLIGGLDEEYGLKELRPVTGEKWAKKFGKLTPAAQVTAILNTFHTNIASLLDAARGDPEAMVKLFKQMGGLVGVEKGDLGASILKSAESRSVQAALKYALNDGDIVDNIYSSWVSATERRAMLDKIATALDMKHGDVLQLLTDKPQVLAKRLNDIAPELHTTPEYLTDTLKVFVGDDALPWNINQFQAMLTIKVADKMDGFFTDVYGLKPEPYVFRLSNVFKSVQSLLLLGFNPAYLMNNWVNNVVTRAAEGVGGYMTAKQINGFYERMGIFPKDTGLSGYDDITGRIVHNAMEVKDNLTKVQRALTKVNHKVGLFTRLSGWSEKMEGTQARVIATKQFLGKESKVGSGIRPFDPITERILDQNYPGLKEGIYGAVNAGLNMGEIEASIKADVVTPKIESILDELGVKYNKNAPGGARDLFDRMGLTERVNEKLKGAYTDAKIDAAFEELIEEFGQKIQEQHIKDLEGVAESTQNLVDSERGFGIQQVMADTALEFGNIWVEARINVESLWAQEASGAITKEKMYQLLDLQQQQAGAKFQRNVDNAIQAYSGVIKAIGIDNEYTRGYVIKLGETQANVRDYWQQQRKLYKEYAERAKQGKGENYDLWQVRKSDLWQQVSKQQNKLYEAYKTRELKLLQDTDTNFVKMYAEYTGWDVQRITAYCARLQEMRKDLFDMQIDMRKRTEGLSQGEKAEEYRNWNPEYNAKIAEYKQFEHDGAYELMNKPTAAEKVVIPEVETPVNPNIDELSTSIEGETGGIGAITADGLALLREEAKNIGFTDAQIDRLQPRQIAEAVNQAKRTATREAKAAREQEIINKMKLEAGKDVVKAKITAEDIMAEADATLRTNKIHENSMIGRDEYIEQLRAADPKATDAEINAAIINNDLRIDQWAKRNGFVPSEAARDAWYATRIAEVRKEIGGLQPGELPLADKGAIQMLSDGRAIIKFFESADFSTMEHELMHVWLWDLPQTDIDIVARLGGLSGADEFRVLRDQFRSGELKAGMDEYNRYVRAEEEFARGHERYLTEGDAPTPELRSIFRQFTDWMLSIYQALQKSMGRVSGFEKTSLDVDIRTQVNGRSLRDIFDNMLVDAPNRPKTFEQLISDRLADVQGRGRNKVRLTNDEMIRIAQKEVIRDIFERFTSQDEARAFLDTMDDYLDLADGTQLDDAALYDGLRLIDENVMLNPWNVVVTKKISGKTATAYTPKGDLLNTQYKVVDLDDIETSDNWVGNAMKPNPSYNQELQKRIRGEKSSIAWMMDKSKPETFKPELILDEFNATDRGAPIIAYENQVWSGNGRVNLMRYGLQQDLGTYEKYRAALDTFAARAGIDPESYADMQHPFLVREITDDLSPEQLERFAADTNKGSSASMSDFENAVNEGARISDESLKMLEVGDTESIEGAIQAARNEMFVKGYLSGFDKDALKEIAYNLKLTNKGVTRIVNALLAKVYQGRSGEKLVRIMANGDNSLVKNQLKVLKDTLPQVAVLEGKIAIGQLDTSLKISDDLSAAIEVLDRIRQNPKMNVREYLNTQQLVSRETTPFQDLLIDFLNTAKPTEARQTIRNYVKLAMSEPDPRQMNMFGDIVTRAKEDIFNDARTVGKLEGDEIDARIAASQTAAPIPGLPEQPINAGTGEGAGGVLRGSEDITGISGQEIPRPADGEPAAVRQPWEMTESEFIWDYQQKAYAENFGETDPEKIAFSLDANKEMRNTIANNAADDHYDIIRQALSEGKPVPPEVLADYPHLVAKSVINAETKADYDAGKAVPIDRAAEIDIAHQDTLPVPEDVSEIINSTDTFKFEKKQQAKDYLEWVLNGEKGKPPEITPEIRAFYEPNIEVMREYAAQKARGVTAEEVAKQIAIPETAIDTKLIKERIDRKWTKYQDETGKFYYELGKHNQHAGKDVVATVYSVNYADPSQGNKMVGIGEFETRDAAQEFINKHYNEQVKASTLTAEEAVSDSFRGQEEWRSQYEDSGEADTVAPIIDKSTILDKPISKNKNNIRGWFVEPSNWDNTQTITWREVADWAANTRDTRIVEVQKLTDPTRPFGETTPEYYVELVAKNGWKRLRKAPKEAFDYYKSRLDYWKQQHQLENNRVIAAESEETRIMSAAQPGVHIQKVYAFKHGDIDCVANVYKDGELVAYAPAVPLKDAQLDADTRILGLDPQFPDKWVYEQDGVIKTVDSRKPEIGGEQSILFQRGQMDIFANSAEDLPLFSGVPMRARDEAFNPKDTSGQLSMFPDIVPETKPTRIIEIAIKDKGLTGYVRMDIRKLKQLRELLKLNEGAEMTARILDVNGKVIESNLDPRDVVNPTMKGQGGTLFQAAETIDTPAFKEYFGDSKVVDENGNPLVVYHGTPEEFQIFDYSKVRTNGTSEGVGFYFTDNRDIAKGYTRGTGEPIETYLSIKKPMTSDQRKITDNQLRRIFQEMNKVADEDGNYYYLSNYGDVERDGINKVISEAVSLEKQNTTDIDLISSIGNGTGINWETLNRIVVDVTGYDGIIVDWNHTETPSKVYVAFLPEQIKSVYNRGTFDQNNPNILFQAAETASPEQLQVRINTILGELQKATTDAGMNLSREQLYEIGDFGIDSYRGLTKEEISKFKLNKAIVQSYGELWMTLNQRKQTGTTKYSDMDPTKVIMPYVIDEWNKAPIRNENMTLGQNNEQAKYMEWTSNTGAYTLRDISEQPREFIGLRKHELTYWEKGKYLQKDFESYAEARDWAIEHAKKYNRNELHQEAEPIPDNTAPIGRAAETATKDWYYSQLGKVLETMPNKMTPDALRGFLNGKVKADELQWTGFEKWISEQQGQISKQDALDFIMENRVKVEEVIHGDTDINKKNSVAEYVAYTTDGVAMATANSVDELTQTMRRQGYRDFEFTINKNDVSASTKFAQWQLPGGENYRELLLTLPVDVSKTRNPTFEEYAKFYGAELTDVNIRQDYAHDLALGRWETKLLKENGIGFESKNYNSPHWQEPNVLAHIRFNDRIDADGKRVLFIEEIQSDWHQAGRESGYDKPIPSPKNPEEFYKTFKVNETKDRWIIRTIDGDKQVTWYPKREIPGLDNIDAIVKQAIKEIPGLQLGTGGVPEAPFSKNWEELAVKRAIRYAAENGYDRVAWTTGKMQSDRYKLGNFIDTLEYGHRLDNNRWILRGSKDGKEVVHRIVEDSELDGAVGVEVAKKMRNLEGKRGQYNPEIDYRILENQDLLIESQGMHAFYDEKVPNIIRKYIKKWGGEVGETKVSTFEYAAHRSDFANEAEWNEARENTFHPVQSFDITPAMRDSVVNQGQPLFQSAEPIPDNTAPIGRVPLNATPVIEPYARVLDEVNSEYIRPLMDDIKQTYKEKMHNPGFKWGEVAPEHQKMVNDYLKSTVNNDLATVKNQAMKYGQMMRDNALLDYSRRYGADAVLQLVFPYQFWYTRSMMNWAKRMVDKPAWFAMYARMQASREKLEREGMPTRLRGKMRINMPWMPDWMGGGIWIDPMSKLFPFHQFGQPLEQYANNQAMIDKRAESIINEMKENELISATEADIALSSRDGTIWKNALGQAELELDKSANPASLVTMMMQPALWWTIPADIAKGTPEKISPLPITRTGQTIKELGRDTFLEGATNVVGDLLAGTETAIRRKAGLSEFGQWGDYYVDRMLAGMAAAGEISTDDARIAMIDRKGAAFDTAVQRIRTEQSLRTPGALGITALKEGAKPGQVLAATLAGIFGGSLFSEGEMKMRGLKPIYDNAWNKLKAGDESALNDFYDKYPEYSARLALYDKPEERLHQFLIDNVWRGYMDLDYENKKLVREALGDEFMDSFLNKETRSYESIDDKTLAMWAQTIKLGTQQMPEAMKDVEGQNIQYYDEPMLQAINTYKDERKARFPNYYMWQNAYYELPAGAERKAFLVAHPQLKQYWQWKDKYAEEHPEIVPYFDDLKNKSTGDVVSSELTQPLIRQLYTYATGGSLSAGAKSEIERIRKQYAPDMTQEQFVQLALSLIMGGNGE